MAVPRLAEDVQLLGRYPGSGFREPRYLIERPDERMLQVSRLLYIVAANLDGRHTAGEIAERVSMQYRRRLTPEGLHFLVEAKLRPLGLVRDGGVDEGRGPSGEVSSPTAPATAAPGLPIGPPPAPVRRLLGLRLRMVVLPSRVVGLLADAFLVLFLPVVVALALGALVTVDLWMWRTASFTDSVTAVLLEPVTILLLLAILFASLVFHEFGHAAACRYGGGRPGAIGMGLYLVYPAMYTDVTDSQRLGRAARLRVDLGGVYFNVLAILVVAAVYAATGYPPLVLAVVLIHLELLQQLLPVVRLDGYYILTDIVGVPDLFDRVRPVLTSLLPWRPTDPRVAELRPRARATVTVWVLLVVPALLAVSGYMLWRAPDMWQDVWAAEQREWEGLQLAWQGGDVGLVVLAMISMLLLALPVLGLALLSGDVALRVARAGVRRVRRPSPQPNPAPALVPAPVTPQEDTVETPTQTMNANGRRGALTESEPARRSGSEEPPALDGYGARGDPWADDARDEARDRDRQRDPDSEHADHASTDRHDDEDTTGEHDDSDQSRSTSAGTNLTAADFTTETMLRSRSQAPTRGWRRSVYVCTRGTVNPGPGRAERREIEQLGRLRTPIRGSRRIVVMSRKGGAGKTTTALMLGHTFASQRGDRVVALDGNPDAGSLAHRIRRQSPETVTTLLEHMEGLHRYADMRGFTSQAPDTRLEVVASDDDPRISEALGAEHYSDAIDVLDRHYNLIIIDTGTGVLDGAIQGVLGEADQIVVVMPPALDGGRVAAMTLDWLEEHDYGALVRSAVAVFNGVRGAAPVELDRMEAHFAARCAGVVRIPWDPALAAGGQTGFGELRHGTRGAFLDLAVMIAEGFGAGSPRRAVR